MRHLLSVVQAIDDKNIKLEIKKHKNMFFIFIKNIKNIKNRTKIQVIRSRVCNVGQVQQSESDSESSDQSTVVSTYFMLVNLSASRRLCNAVPHSPDNNVKLFMVQAGTND